MGVEIISRPDQRCLDLDELGRVVQRGRVCVQRLHRSGPGAGEIGVDRDTSAVDEPSSRPINRDQKRGVDRGNGIAVRVQPPISKDPEGGREFSVDFRWIGKYRHLAYCPPRANRRGATGRAAGFSLTPLAAVVRARTTWTATNAAKPSVTRGPIGSCVISDTLRGLSASRNSAASAIFSQSARR